jgi:hypothetical protein
MVSADLMIEISLELGEDVLRFDEICIDNLDTAWGPLGRLQSVFGVAHEAEGAVVEHEDKVSWAGGEHRLGLISASVALGHGGRHDVSGGLGLSVGRGIARLGHKFGEGLDELAWGIIGVDSEGFAAGYDFRADLGGLGERFAESAGISAGERVAGFELGLGRVRLLSG